MKHITRLLCAFPALVLACFYGTWFAGRAALGHWPRASFDDPKDIKGGMMWMYDVSSYLIYIGVPLFCFALVVLGAIVLAGRQEGWKKRLIELGIALFLFVGLVLFARWDPQSVIEWYFD
jgi:hypothetical protein